MELSIRVVLGLLHATLLLICCTPPIEALDNGLARTPPMGWMSWQRYRCQTNCIIYPDECMNENLIKRMANRLAFDGYKEAGYEYLIIDDCWMAKERDRITQELVADPIRFPSGIKALGEYIHGRGLKFGIYLDYGTLTCAGYPGSMHHLDIDARSLAQWGVDYVKVDGCNCPPDELPSGYQRLGRYMNTTGRPIVYSCSYPAYVNWRQSPELVNWKELQKNCNLWRMIYDIQDSWDSLLSIINIYQQYQKILQPLSGPGHWNDPDMLLLGNFGLSYDQQRVQMGMWCMFAAPLILSADMERIDFKTRQLLLNPRLLAINQDKKGRQAQFLGIKQGVQLWSRAITHKDAKWAIAFLYQVSGGGPIHLQITLTEMGLRPYRVEGETLYTLRDVFDGTIFGMVKIDEPFFVRVNPTGIAMYEVEEKRGATRSPWFDFISQIHPQQR